MAATQFKTENFKKLILERLKKEAANLKSEFYKNQKELGIGFVIIDQLLPEDLALKIAKSFDDKLSVFREMNSFREKKLTSKQFQALDPILGEITFAFQEPEVVDFISELTSIRKQIPDDKLYAGGLSIMRKNDFLDPHIDNSHDQQRQNYRRLNLLYYVSSDWTIENGGHLQLWDKKVMQPVTIPSFFNRLVLMETHKYSWHSVSKVNVQALRKCVSNYYFSQVSPSGETYYHVTSFMARPEQPFKRILCKVDNFLRATLRKIKPDGLGKNDVFESTKTS